MARWIPDDAETEAALLREIGIQDAEELFADVPRRVRLGRMGVGAGREEIDVVRTVDKILARNRPYSGFANFLGGRIAPRFVPAAVDAILLRSEFYTSYTPYQPEVAQGILQAVFEFQTMVARLAGLPVANASLYDGANALVEAVNLGVAASGRQRVWLSSGAPPHWRAVLKTFAAGTGHVLVDVPLEHGLTVWPDAAAASDAGEPPGVLVVGYPNYLGCLEDIGAARRICDATGALLVVVADPVSAAILRS
ncbi:MAG TPA: glycine dehydrogenase, partial [Thermoplasmata archaeon]|nr:glycine dehydrogenase [Thermoplasmata archaeon]